jgi:hypothetical protein
VRCHLGIESGGRYLLRNLLIYQNHQQDQKIGGEYAFGVLGCPASVNSAITPQHFIFRAFGFEKSQYDKHEFQDQVCSSKQRRTMKDSRPCFHLLCSELEHRPHKCRN